MLGQLGTVPFVWDMRVCGGRSWTEDEKFGCEPLLGVSPGLPWPSVSFLSILTGDVGALQTSSALS